MRRTIINAVLFLVLFVGPGGAHVAMPHNDYEGCDGKCEQRLEAASLQCLAETIYYEAGNQPIKGEVAVGYVVFNRAKQNHVSICDVVYQSGHPVRRFVVYQKTKSNLRSVNISQEICCRILKTSQTRQTEQWRFVGHKMPHSQKDGQ